MGGRGASAGVYLWRNRLWYYGDEYTGVFKGDKFKNLSDEDKQFLIDNKVLFVKNTNGSAMAPMETLTEGRIYVAINNNGNIKFVSFYDAEGAKNRQIDIDYEHGRIANIHGHTGYDIPHNGVHEPLTADEGRLIKRIIDIWKRNK